ncbi:MAG TPA: PD-(D/E)XK nuclease family protein [Bacteroidales bacterium]|nr:PD-(D/E)XK nuclease family protein [Bacteroidales bacterium]
MKSFLEFLAKHIYDRHRDSTGEQCIVFPNRRAGLFFMKYLSSVIEKPVWSPAVKTINELFGTLSPLLKAENELLVFELYKAYREINSKAEPFDSFYYWGEMILNDFDDVDKYLVDAGKIFSNLSDLKKIDSTFGGLSQEEIEIIRRFWVNFNAGKYTGEKENFLGLWSVLPELYIRFRDNLRQNGIAYEGMIFRDGAMRCLNGDLTGLPWKTFHFAGFNALNRCEKILLKSLKDTGKARFYWDYDESYTEKNSSHSAGYFIKENISIFGNDMPEEWSYNTFLSQPSVNVSREIISTSSDIAQVKLIPELLGKILEKEGMPDHQTAIVLADENLLIPLLSSIPEFITDVNITMGYPLKFSPVYSFLKMLLNLQKNGRTENGVTFFASGDVTGLLRHSFLSDETKYHSGDIVSRIISEGRSWIPSTDICSSPALEMIFRKVESTAVMPSYIRTILEEQYIIENEDENNAVKTISLHNEFIFRALQVLNRFEDITVLSGITMTIVTWSDLFDRILKGISVPFSGEPLSGIQIMGLLETRVLDFRNIIMLSVNEGVLPRSSAGSSYIPYNLREAFGLPVIRHQDSIYSYYFYRLLHRAENAVFVYNSNAEGLKTGEMSRLLMQLNYLSGSPPSYICQGYEVSVRPPLPDTVERTPGHQQVLENRYFGENGSSLSPRAVNTWINCRMQFYYRYVCGLEEPDRISEGIDSAEFGTLLHDIMQRIYSDLLNRRLSAQDIRKIASEKNKLEKTVRDAVTERFHTTKDESLTGREEIAASILVQYVKKILEKDENAAPFAVSDLEKNIVAPFDIVSNGNPVKIKLGGIVDRIDSFAGKLRILDYKTGDIPMEIKSFESLFDAKNRTRPGEWLQILIYCEILSRIQKYDILPVIYSVRQVSKSDVPGILTIKNASGEKVVMNYSEVKDIFSSLLREVLKDIFNRNENFIMTENLQKCSFCPYSELCNR